jgi:hypothetical protein
MDSKNCSFEQLYAKNNRVLCLICTNQKKLFSPNKKSFFDRLHEKGKQTESFDSDKESGIVTPPPGMPASTKPVKEKRRGQHLACCPLLFWGDGWLDFGFRLFRFGLAEVGQKRAAACCGHAADKQVGGTAPPARLIGVSCGMCRATVSWGFL